MAYGQLETESSLETDPSIEVQSDWPMNGHIELRKLSYRHSSEGPLVLKEISCDIKSREKVHSRFNSMQLLIFNSDWNSRSYWSW